jgi:hypothetical protein
MKANLYLSSLHQDLIDQVRTEQEFKRVGGGVAWTLCCDGFCCVLDFSKFQDPTDLVSAKRDPLRWYIRKEDFGGLLWNPDTNRVFELDDQAYNVLMTLQEGTGLKRALKTHRIQVNELHALLAQVSEPAPRKEKAQPAPKSPRRKKRTSSQ